VCTAYATYGLLDLVYEMCAAYLIFCFEGWHSIVGIATFYGLESGD
jgi:hypothetical protein